MTASPLDLTLLMAKAGLLAEIGGAPYAIHWDLMRPEIKIAPLGDVLANYDYVDDIVAPHGRLFNENLISDAVESYADNMEALPALPVGSVEDRLNPLFAEAWREQFGASVDETRAFVDFIENIGFVEEKATIAIPRSRLRGIEGVEGALDDMVAARLVDAMTLRSRSSWRETPSGFKDKDRFPWLLRRRLSFLRRPLLQLDEADDPTLLIAPGAVRESFAYTIHSFYRGNFHDDQLSPKMLKWKAKTAGERGTIFAKKVAEALSGDGWQTRVEIKVTELLGRGFDRDHGEVDVLAWRGADRRVLIIECKDVQFRKNIGEIAEQLADFRGEIRPNGKRDELRKHLDRMDIIRAHLNAVSRFTGIAPLHDVESHLMFKNPAPMEFALKRMSERVKVSHFARIGAI